MKGYEIKFWRDFLDADVLDRQEMISKLPALQEFKKYIEKEDGELLVKTFDMIMYSLFDDLATEAFYYYSK